MIGEGLMARAQDAGEARCRALALALANEARGAGVTARASDSTVVLSGRGLMRRWLEVPALRFLGWAR